jgi:hypothetical protein
MLGGDIFAFQLKADTSLRNKNIAAIPLRVL